MLRHVLLLILIALSSIAAAETQTGRKPETRAPILQLIGQIKRADYEDDRTALRRLHEELIPPSGDRRVASRVLYWRGFALWRRAINGFSDGVPPKVLEADLNGALADFHASLARDPAFVESEIAAASCYSTLIFLNPAKTRELIRHSSPLLKHAMTVDPDNPRLLWVLGPIRWNSPPERGGGQDKALALYDRGIDAFRMRAATDDPLEPSWGAPELLMARAWSNLNKTTPDLTAARKDADAALQLVPYWHYVREVLIRQILEAQTKSRGHSES